ADRNRSHWSTSKTPSYTKSVSWQHHPIFLPVVTELGMDPIHFGIVMVLNMCIGICTPPVGSVLFVGCSVSKLPINKIIKPMLPFYAVMVLVLAMVTYIPQISMALPRALGY
ncbi:TRAP transporter large permease subunit, partial [Escherichia coli]